MKDQKNNKKTLKVAAEASSNEKKKRDPIIHITKRGQLSTAKSIGIRAAAIFAALLVGGLISVLVTGKNPIDIYVSIFCGGITLILINQ